VRNNQEVIDAYLGVAAMTDASAAGDRAAPATQGGRTGGLQACLIAALRDGGHAQRPDGGVMYALVALGFVLIFKASGIFNFAQGVMALFAALTLVGFQNGQVPFAHLINAIFGTRMHHFGWTMPTVWRS
jgi:hypothetical protein